MSTGIGPSSPVRTQHHGRVLAVTVDNPPVNALGADARRGLVEAIEAAEADAAVAAVLIVGAGRGFIAGADIREFAKLPVPPSLPEVSNRVESCCKPVVAAMINEGANVVHQRIALRPLDVDAVFFHGYGFPRWRGGPMKYADRGACGRCCPTSAPSRRRKCPLLAAVAVIGRVGRARRRLPKSQPAGIKGRAIREAVAAALPVLALQAFRFQPLCIARVHLSHAPSVTLYGSQSHCLNRLSDRLCP